jgi:indolepyruvate ferredoxin oxidoreductase alpha subunit
MSEKYDTPVLVRMCTRVGHSQSVVEIGERVVPPEIPYGKNAHKYVMMPTYARPRHPFVEKRTLDLAAYAEETTLNRIEMCDSASGSNPDLGIITSGTAYQYVKEVVGDSVSVLKLGLVYPLPEKLILDFAAKFKKLIVVEELDSVLEDHCKKLGLKVTGKEMFSLIGEISQNMVAEKLNMVENNKYPIPEWRSIEDEIPMRPPVMCAGCSHRGLFYVLGKIKAVVHGDIGCYTLGAAPPLNSMDTCLCMGAATSSLHGYVRAGGKNAVCVIGDSTFAHMGVNGLIDIAYNGSDSTVIIVDNLTTGMTGHQENPTTGYNIKGEKVGRLDLEALSKAVGIDRVVVVDPNDLETTEKVIREEMATSGPSVIIARRPCILLKSAKPNPPLTVDNEKCNGCSVCMKIGCPAISVKDKKAGINHTLCVGCNVCVQLCKADAFVERKGV